MTVSWSVIWSVLRTLLVAGGPVSVLLIALGFPPVQVSEWLGIALAAVGVLSVAVPGILGALTHTDAAKVNAIATLPTAAANEAVTLLPQTARSAIKIATISDQALVTAAAALPDVAKIEVTHDAGPALSAVAENPGQPKVITEGSKS